MSIKVQQSCKMNRFSLEYNTVNIEFKFKYFII